MTFQVNVYKVFRFQHLLQPWVELNTNFMNTIV